jgi:hypothetical protein
MQKGVAKLTSAIDKCMHTSTRAALLLYMPRAVRRGGLPFRWGLFVRRTGH